MAISVAGLVVEVDGKPALYSIKQIEGALASLGSQAERTASAVNASAGVQTRAMGQVAAAATATGVAGSRMAAQAQASARGAAAVGAAAARSATQVTSLSRSMNTAAASLQRFTTASSSFRGLFTFLTGAGAFGIVAHGMIELANAAALTGARLELVNKGYATNIQMQRDLFAIAQAGRTAYDDTANLFVRLAGSAQKLGLSYQQLLTFTDSINKAFLISGATSKESTNALVQLGQVLSSNRFQGDELRGLFENFPGFVRALEIGSGKTRDELRKMASAGELTGKTLIEWIGKARDFLVESAERIPVTFGQAMTMLRNDLQAFLYALDQNTKTTPALVGFINDIREQLQDPAFLGQVTEFLERLGKTLGFLKDNAEFLLKALVAIDAVSKGLRVPGPPIVKVGAAVGIGALGVLGVDAIFNNDEVDEKTERLREIDEAIRQLQDTTREGLTTNIGEELNKQAPGEKAVEAFWKMADAVVGLWEKLQGFYDWLRSKSEFFGDLIQYGPAIAIYNEVTRDNGLDEKAREINRITELVSDLEKQLAGAQNAADLGFAGAAEEVAKYESALMDARAQLEALKSTSLETLQIEKDRIIERMEKEDVYGTANARKLINIGKTTGLGGAVPSGEQGSGEDKALKRAQDRLRDLRIEADLVEQLAKARQQGVAQYEITLDMQEAERIILDLGIEAHGKLADAIRAEVLRRQEAQDAIDAENVALEAQAEILDVLRELKEEAIALEEKHATAAEKLAKGLKKVAELQATTDLSDAAAAAEVRELQKAALDAQPIFVDLKEAGMEAGRAIADSFFAAASGASTFKEALADLGTQLLDLLYNLLIIQPLMRELEDFFYTQAGATGNPASHVMNFGGESPSSGIFDLIGAGIGLLGGLFGFGGGYASGVPGVGPGGMGFTHFGGPRAAGGPVRRGLAYLVGEKGPELFMPGKSGSIIPHRANGGWVEAMNPYMVGERGGELYIPADLQNLGRGADRWMNGRNVVNNFNISTPNADSFRASQGQIMSQAARAMSKSARRDG